MENFGELPGDRKIEVALDHRTFIVLKSPDHPEPSPQSALWAHPELEMTSP